jgi:hypothetical protein
MAKNEVCNGCDLYTGESCRKWRENGKCQPSDIKWFIDDYGAIDFIAMNRMCRKSSIFGNDYIGLTQNDIDRLKNGEVIHIGGEYGTFIGFLSEKDGE